MCKIWQKSPSLAVNVLNRLHIIWEPLSARHQSLCIIVMMICYQLFVGLNLPCYPRVSEFPRWGCRQSLVSDQVRRQCKATVERSGPTGTVESLLTEWHSWETIHADLRTLQSKSQDNYGRGPTETVESMLTEWHSWETIHADLGTLKVNPKITIEVGRLRQLSRC